MGTNYTQCVYRIHLRHVTPQDCVDDLTVMKFDKFQRDPSLGHFCREPTLFDESILFLLDTSTTGFAARKVTDDPPPFTLSIRFPIAPARVPVGLAAVPTPLPATPVAPPYFFSGTYKGRC